MARIGICAGHYPSRSGAVNRKFSLNEHQQALMVNEILVPILIEQGHEVFEINGTLSQKIARINELNLDAAFDVHFNAGGGHGCEVIYVPGSDYRFKQATKMSAAIAKHLGVNDRGAKEGWYQGGSNPGTKRDAFVSKTNCAAFVPEPFFIDNNAEVEEFLVSRRHKDIAIAIANGIESIVGG